MARRRNVPVASVEHFKQTLWKGNTLIMAGKHILGRGKMLSRGRGAAGQVCSLSCYVHQKFQAFTGHGVKTINTEVLRMRFSIVENG